MLLGINPAGGSEPRHDNRRTVWDVVQQYRDKIESRLLPRFRYAGAEWPPQAVQLLALKDSRNLELWVLSGGEWKHIRDYRIKGMSGGFGPKLREGDRQVPEGHYRIVQLNPNSAYHLSMKIDYPNRFDRARAVSEGRTNLGGDIFIHGKDISRGCLAIGDNAIEELFVLSALVGKHSVSILIAPVDFRRSSLPRTPAHTPFWVEGLHARIAMTLERFPRENN